MLSMYGLFASKVKRFPNVTQISWLLSVVRRMSGDMTGKKLVWVDCEMTGLDVNADRLLEVAVIVTNGNLDTIRQLGPYVIQTSKQILDQMNDWCVKTHNESPEHFVTDLSLDWQLLHLFFDKLRIGSNGYDRLFLNKYCPKFSSCLHYRTVDVSTIKELVRIWYKKDESFRKQLTHRAIDDINESIAELKFYRQNYFIDK
ncbi:unnamed protein product, partial [Oppiella nova]